MTQFTNIVNYWMWSLEKPNEVNMQLVEIGVVGDNEIKEKSYMALKSVKRIKGIRVEYI